VPTEFHISRAARDRYEFDETLFSLSGNVLFANFHAVRIFVQKVNDKRDLARFPEQTMRAGHLNAMGLIDEILHFIFGLYREQQSPGAAGLALTALEEKVGKPALDKALRHFVEQFPPVAVYRGEIATESYLDGTSDGVPNRQIALEEMLMLWLANANPAFTPFHELFDDTSLAENTAYPDIIAGLAEFFAMQPFFGPDNQSLVEMLHSPAVVVPNSLTGQLAYILEKWGYLLGKYFYRLLLSQDLMKEEEKGGMPGGGAGRAEVYVFAGQEVEAESFSQDRDWMPRLVVLAKNIYVWLDQLSKKYRRTIRFLDQIPDEELDILARWGFSGLWLIGLWERSRASQKIKQLCGNPEAVASAYSLFDYQIAADLGGEGALQNLKDRAWRRGIRLASDMVPNHMGIDSRWVIDHPDWFIALDHSPFPSYRFDGPDLSNDQRVGIFLEDHYYSRSDAAVVFKRLDRWTGSVKYVYHGNDGTSMPWNDTAQLNFLDPQVREAVIQTILEVARKFSVIRFDAAMTLARKHVQRLWFPEPGSGGAIPSRAEHGLTRDQFFERMPHEFWREVVDRVAKEVPDTLLLAEAFWMMEGYFVRTLGMHRVYNSAFMNMLKNEDNANYRSVLKNTLEFNPEILKRFVNFMNNPDEETAVAQFGKDGKYFGVCTLMATLPGLPMFGHGQIEGLTEKYGMEYRRAYRDEQADETLVRRHEREIFPLMRRRYLFAEVGHFYLYDLFTPEGPVNEDVFAYSNRSGDERALVVYHNKFATARGWIRVSATYLGKTGAGEERALMQKPLGTALGLEPAGNQFTIFRDHVSGLEFIRNNQDLFDRGLYVELAAFTYHVFLDFRQVRDNEGRQYAQLADYLAGRGVPSMDVALRELFLRPIHQPFKELVNVQFFRRLLDACAAVASGTEHAEEPNGLAAPRPAILSPDLPASLTPLLDEVEQKMVHLLTILKQFAGGAGDEVTLAWETRQQLEAVLQLPLFARRIEVPAGDESQAATDFLRDRLAAEPRPAACLFGWAIVHALGRIVGDIDAVHRSRGWLDEFLLGRIIAGVLTELGMTEPAVQKSIRLIGLLTTHQQWYQLESGDPPTPRMVLEAILKDGEGQQFLMVNRYRDIVWFTGEALDDLLGWLFLIAVIQSTADPLKRPPLVAAEVLGHYRIIAELRRACVTAEHQVEKLLGAVES
jgi:glycosidase